MNSAANQTADVINEREMISLGLPSREEKIAQLEKLLQARLLHGSENLRAFLRYVGMQAIDHPENELKEYVIATEVFGRSGDFNPKIDSVVRVQAGRLRSKLLVWNAMVSSTCEIAEFCQKERWRRSNSLENEQRKKSLQRSPIPHD
jgi:hypothetical protein